MAELTFQHLLSRSLLDRLAGDDTDTVSATEPQLRESVRRDLASLFNTIQLGTSFDLQDFPEVSRSVLNYGIVDLAGRTLSSIDLTQLTDSLQRAIVAFEPRVLARSLVLTPHLDRNRQGRRAIIIDIAAELWSQPVPIALHLRSEIDLETGAIVLEESDEET